MDWALDLNPEVKDPYRVQYFERWSYLFVRLASYGERKQNWRDFSKESQISHSKNVINVYNKFT